MDSPKNQKSKFVNPLGIYLKWKNVCICTHNTDILVNCGTNVHFNMVFYDVFVGQLLPWNEGAARIESVWASCTSRVYPQGEWIPQNKRSSSDNNDNLWNVGLTSLCATYWIS